MLPAAIVTASPPGFHWRLSFHASKQEAPSRRRRQAAA